MEVKQIEAIKARIKPKIEKGDFITLAKILEVPRETAISRYNRNKLPEVILMRKIVASREKLIITLKKAI